MELKYKKVSPRGMAPVTGSAEAAGIDLIAVSKNKTESFIEYGTGLAFEIPKGYVGLLFPRSSISNTSLILANSVGVIDSDYRGEVRCRFKKVDKLHTQEYNLGERVCQLVLVPITLTTPVEVDELEDTERGEGGFGSTGA